MNNHDQFSLDRVMVVQVKTEAKHISFMVYSIFTDFPFGIEQWNGLAVTVISFAFDIGLISGIFNLMKAIAISTCFCFTILPWRSPHN